MKRQYRHRYRVISGAYAGTTADGVQIGVQDYLDQFVIEGFNHEQIKAKLKERADRGEGEGIWLLDLKVAIHPTATRPPIVSIDEEGVNYSNTYIDLAVPFDRYGREIMVGDELYAAVKNEVRIVRVTKIAKKPYMANYGIIHRKLTVVDDIEGQTLTINDPRSTVKVDAPRPGAQSGE